MEAKTKPAGQPADLPDLIDIHTHIGRLPGVVGEGFDVGHPTGRQRPPRRSRGMMPC